MFLTTHGVTQSAKGAERDANSPQVLQHSLGCAQLNAHFSEFLCCSVSSGYGTSSSINLSLRELVRCLVLLL